MKMIRMKAIHPTKPARGYIALVSAIIISAVLIALVSQAGMEAYFVRFNTVDSAHKKEASAAADSCACIALLALAENSSYIPKEPGETISIDSTHTCVIDTLQTEGDNLVIRSHAQNAGSYAQTIVTLSATPSLTIKKWQSE